MSALPSKADMCGATRHVRYVPIATKRPFLFLLSPIRAREEGAAALWLMAERWSPAPTMVSELRGHRQPIAKFRALTLGTHQRKRARSIERFYPEWRRTGRKENRRGRPGPSADFNDGQVASPPRFRTELSGSLFDDRGQRKQRLLVERAADQL